MKLSVWEKVVSVIRLLNTLYLALKAFIKGIEESEGEWWVVNFVKDLGGYFSVVILKNVSGPACADALGAID